MKLNQQKEKVNLLDIFNDPAIKPPAGSGECSAPKLLQHAFLNDLTKQNLAKDVVGLTFSEFGRKVAQNGNLGTDHGEIAPMFVFGAPVAGGVSGTNPDLTEATDRNNFQIKTVQYDYRQTFGTLLQDFIGADQSIIDAAFFNHTSNSSFADAKIPELLRKPLSQTCQNAVLTSFNTPENKAWTLSPNPFKDFINFTSSENNNTTVSYNIYNAAGLLILSNTMPLSNGFASINLQFLKRGFYIFEMKVGNKKEIHKVVKI